MKYNKDKVDEMTLALMYLTTEGHRTWKGYDWDTMNRLYEKGYISNPASKNRSVAISEEGMNLSEKLFEKHFK
jgi:hypothetical protein